MRSDYEERKAQRIERLEKRAEAQRVEANRRGNAALEMASRMQGEPIKVGHHSEKRHRSDIKRMDQNMHKAAELSREAERNDHRAEAAKTNRAISSDDPEAADLLRAKLDDMKRRRDYMKKINAAYRKAGKPAQDDPAGWPKVAKLAEITEAMAERIRRGMSTVSWETMPFPGYALSNLGANIRRVKKRIEDMKVLAMDADAGTATRYTFNGGYCIDSAEDNRFQVFFDERPSRDVCKKMRRHGFRWARSVGAWQRQRGGNAMYAAQQALGELTEGGTGDGPA